MNNILLLHGINLNIMGKRDVKHYSSLTLEDLETFTTIEASQYGFKVVAYQSNHEGDLVNKLQKEASNSVGIIINAGAFTHYSYGLYDALIDTQLPIIEVHLSNLSEREDFRKHSVIAPACIKVIEGKHERGYKEEVHFLIAYLKYENN